MHLQHDRVGLRLRWRAAIDQRGAGAGGWARGPVGAAVFAEQPAEADHQWEQQPLDDERRCHHRMRVAVPPEQVGHVEE